MVMMLVLSLPLWPRVESMDPSRTEVWHRGFSKGGYSPAGRNWIALAEGRNVDGLSDCVYS